MSPPVDVIPLLREAEGSEAKVCRLSANPPSPPRFLRTHPQEGHKGRLYCLCEETEKDTAATSFRACIISVDHIYLFFCPVSGCVYVCVCIVGKKNGWGGSEALAQYPIYLLRHPWYVV